MSFHYTIVNKVLCRNKKKILVLKRKLQKLNKDRSLRRAAPLSDLHV